MRVGGLLRYRYVVLALLAGVAAWLVIWDVLHTLQVDYLTSLFGGWAIFGWLPTFHHPGLHVYALNPAIQVGPLALVFTGLLAKIPGETGRYIVAATAVACALPTVWAVERTALSVGVSARRAQVTTLLGGPFVIAAFAAVSWYAHVEDALAITLTALAVAAVASRRPWWVPALLLGVALTCKPWAVVSLPLLLALDRDRVRAIGGAVAVAVVGWAPFVVAAPDTIRVLGSFPSAVLPHSALRVFGFAAHVTAPQGIRSAEMLLGVCFAALAVSRGRWLAAPLAGFAGRLMIEPRWFLYYGALAVVGALLWDATRDRRLPVWTLWTVVAEFAAQLASPIVGAVFNMAFAVSVVGFLVLAPAVRPQRVRVPAYAGVQE